MPHCEGRQFKSKLFQAVVEVMDDAMADVLRRKTPAERLHVAANMWRSARAILRGAIRSTHPDWDPARVDLEVARRISHGLASHEPA